MWTLELEIKSGVEILMNCLKLNFRINKWNNNNNENNKD